ncbi:unnamed protein product [Phaeothamnion confervicola]
MAANHEYLFSGAKFAVYTWYGCEVETTGPTLVAYQSSETPMIQYVNSHSQLEARRTRALEELQTGRGAANGPRVIVVGPPDSGKTALACILAAYAVRMGRTPTYVDLDVSAGQITVPGVLAAAAMDQTTLSIEEGFTLAAPLVFHYGHTHPADNPELYKLLVEELASAVEQRQTNDPEARTAGLVVNTCGWIEGVGYQLLLHAVGALAADVVLVMGHDRLYADLTAGLPDAVVVVKVPRSGGVVQRDVEYRRRERATRIREYFYGAGAGGAAAGAGGGSGGPLGRPAAAPPLSPSVLELKLDDVRVYRVGGAQISDSMLPLGQASLLGPTRVARVRPTAELTHSLLAVCHPVLTPDGTVVGQEVAGGEDDERAAQELLRSNAAGFVYVTEVNMETRRMTVLTPCPGALPSNYLFVGNIKWAE